MPAADRVLSIISVLAGQTLAGLPTNFASLRRYPFGGYNRRALVFPPTGLPPMGCTFGYY